MLKENCLKDYNITNNSRLSILFGFFSVLVLIVMLGFSFFLTPNYSFFECTVSSLGQGNGKFFFSVGFIVAGSFSIPFVIHLNHVFKNLSKHIRKVAFVLAIFSNVCIALVGIIPDEDYMNIFTIFHGIVAFVGFGGTSIHIFLYSILMYQNSDLEKHKKYLLYYGFFIIFVLILLLITMNPFIEWVLLILIIIWVMMTAIQCIKK